MPTSMPVSRILGRLPARSSASSTISLTSECQFCFAHRPEVASADQASLVVVRAEIGRAGMRHLDRDERDPCLAILGGDNRRHVLIGLELDDQIHLLADEDVGVPLGDLRAVSVVD